MTETKSIAEAVGAESSDIVVDGLPVRIEGEGATTLVFVHGWPDTAALWRRQIEAFRAARRCVSFTLPGFDVHGPRRGHSLAELVDTLARIVDATSPDAPVTLVLHDWGCLFGYQYARRYPARVARIVAVDIGDAHSAEYRRSLSLRQVALIAGYQLWLALAWRLGAWWPRLADGMTRWMARRMGCRSDPTLIGACMNYPYDITWFGSFGGFHRLPPLQPAMPLLYVWARRKPVSFHSPSWLERIAAQPGNEVHAIDAGHWLMVQRAEAFNAIVRRWLDAGDAAQPPVASRAT